MSINLTITASSPEELAHLLRGLAAAVPGVAQDPAPESTQPKRETRKTSTKSEATTAPPATETPSETPGEATSTEETNTPTVTLEEIRARLAELVRAGKQAQVKELFPKFGATKLSEVPEDRWGELFEEAGKIA
ncbi:MAG: hypothetical protein ACOY93_18530 [Bacillota bacterium]